MQKLFDKFYGIDKFSLTGRRDTHVKYSQELQTYLHPEALSAITNLCSHAKKDGISLGIYSGFRSFNFQASMWNTRLLGNRVILDNQGAVVDIKQYSTNQLVDYLVKWVSIPGTSRHHWGTDIDIFDTSKSLNDNFTLMPAHFISDGMFYDVYKWMSQNAHNYGFYRPYSENQIEFQPEPWHWSYYPLANQFIEKFEINMVIDSLQDIDLISKDYILKNIEPLFLRCKKVKH